jgi:2,4-diaminopentanoate dehydrogenase
MAYRIVQWATGAKGMVSLREIIRHPDLDLVGLRVYDPAKVGSDAGDLAGTAPTGVIGTDQIEDILALDADCVVYMAQMRYPMEEHHDNICRLLASGKNVAAMTGYYWPATHGASLVGRLEAACSKGGSTLFGTGFSPGFFTERMALQMTEACSRVDSIHYLELCDCSHNNATIIVDMMGCGRPPSETVLDSHTTRLTEYYHFEVLDAMAQQLNAG